MYTHIHTHTLTHPFGQVVTVVHRNSFFSRPLVCCILNLFVVGFCLLLRFLFTFILSYIFYTVYVLYLCSPVSLSIAHWQTSCKNCAAIFIEDWSEQFYLFRRRHSHLTWHLMNLEGMRMWLCTKDRERTLGER